LSRATGRGDGAVIGGKIGLMIDPNLLANLAAGREIALISGTNGKTTTTRLTAAAIGVRGEVATNSFGANMPTGHTSALAKAGHTPYAVLEVDEHYLPQVIAATSPKVIALLNLSRDQLDRAKEVAMMAQLWRDTLAHHPVHVVANADDPMITWAANATLAAGGRVTWVAAGQRWHDDSWVCPECGAHIERGQTSTPAGTPISAPEVPAVTAVEPVPVETIAPIPAEIPLIAPIVPPVDLPPDSTQQFSLRDIADALGEDTGADDDTADDGPAPTAPAFSTETQQFSLDDIAEALARDDDTASPAPAVSASTQQFSLDDIAQALGKGGDTASAGDAPADDADVTSVLRVPAFEAASAPPAPAAVEPVSPAPVTASSATDAPTPYGAAAEAVAAAEQAADFDGSGDWHCTGCTLHRPVTTWHVDGDAVIDPTGRRLPVSLQLPGRVNRANAATALAVAAAFGVDPALAVPRLAGVASIAGRYAQVDRDGRNIRLLLAKNPAGWLEAFDMAENAPTLLSINSRDPDGLDTSWLFDVDFSPLHGRTVLISGERAYDLAVRLEVNEIAFTHVRTFPEALAAVPPGRLEVIANYTAFQDIRAELDRVN
jgi:UDP-N-acetylmuramyl tripeptide synthase